MATKTLMSRGGAVRLARQAHNLKVVGSNPTPATFQKFLHPNVAGWSSPVSSSGS